MRGISIAAALLVTGVLTGGQSARAGLVGDMVNGSYFYPDSATNAIDGGTAVVSPPAVFSFATGVPNTTATVTDGQIVITFDAAGSYNPATFSGVVITDLTVSDITGASIDAATTVAAFIASDLSFTSSSISINLEGLEVPADGQIVIDVATSTSVPEPISMSLIGTGLLGLGIARRRRSA